MTQPRPVKIQLNLYTDAPLHKLTDPDVWRDLMLGKNPTWVDEGRQAMVRIQEVHDMAEATVEKVKVKLADPVPNADTLRDEKALKIPKAKKKAAAK